ncbi:MAG TPA: DUF4388 domain-containing protein [Myxococcota bacterium]|nr:DUF4388 domain-containing protein [Myxococcota bacterium]
MTVALRGNLSDFGIGEVFQLIGQQRKTGVLEVDGATGDRIHVGFVDGSVVTAALVGPHEDAALGDMLVRSGLLTAERLLAIEQRVEAEEDTFRRLAIHQEGLAARDVDQIEDLVTRETLFELLRWTTGSFHFSAQKVRTRTPETRGSPAEQILMDGLRMIDEWRTFDPEATRADAVFKSAAGFEVYRSSVRGESPRALADAQRLFDLLDGTAPVRRAIDQSRLGSFEGARILTALRRVGAIEPIAAGSAPKAKRVELTSVAAAPLPAVPLWRRAPAAAIPFLVLLAVAWLAQRAPAPVAPGLLGDPLVAARSASEALRLRNAAEAFRFAEGRWPADLGELTAAAGAGPMAGGEASPYLVEVEDGSPAVLAPEH